MTCPRQLHSLHLKLVPSFSDCVIFVCMQVKTASGKGWSGFTTWIQGGSKNEEEENDEDDKEKEVVVDDEEPPAASKPAQSGLPKPAGGRYGALGGDTAAKPQPTKQQWDDDDGWGDWGWGDSNGTGNKKDS